MACHSCVVDKNAEEAFGSGLAVLKRCFASNFAQTLKPRAAVECAIFKVSAELSENTQSFRVTAWWDRPKFQR